MTENQKEIEVIKNSIFDLERLLKVCGIENDLEYISLEFQNGRRDGIKMSISSLKYYLKDVENRER